MFHIKYVIDSINSCKTAVQNIRAMIITSLFNAPATIENFYSAKV